ncbi:hypothetical protein SLS59_008211 [Nothophoma quercina]|uniref:Uncharacterized protein n=1 Tax=Nothophoma quercina TaxID=749835 RepID=A0ABR3QU33_9PLEO
MLNVAEEQLKWILNKGDLILSDKPRRVEQKFTLRLDRQRQDTYIIPIYRNLESEEGRPTRLSNARDEVETACELVIDLSKISFASNRRPGRILKPGTEIIYQATLTIVLELDWNTLSASVWWSGRLLTQSPVEYPPNH